MSIKQFRHFLVAAMTLGSAIALSALSAEAGAEQPNMSQIASSDSAETCAEQPNMTEATQAEESWGSVSDTEAEPMGCSPFECICPKGYWKHCEINASGTIYCYCKKLDISG